MIDWLICLWSIKFYYILFIFLIVIYVPQSTHQPSLTVAGMLLVCWRSPVRSHPSLTLTQDWVTTRCPVWWTGLTWTMPWEVRTAWAGCSAHCHQRPDHRKAWLSLRMWITSNPPRPSPASASPTKASMSRTSWRAWLLLLWRPQRADQTPCHTLTIRPWIEKPKPCYPCSSIPSTGTVFSLSQCRLVWIWYSWWNSLHNVDN